MLGRKQDDPIKYGNGHPQDKIKVGINCRGAEV